MNLTKTMLAVSSAVGLSDLVKAVETLSLNDVLGVAGLERRPTSLERILPAAGLITISAAVGAGVALLLAPSSGSRLRAKLAEGIGEAKHRLSESTANYDAPKTSRHAVS